MAIRTESQAGLPFSSVQGDVAETNASWGITEHVVKGTAVLLRHGDGHARHPTGTGRHTHHSAYTGLTPRSLVCYDCCLFVFSFPPRGEIHSPKPEKCWRN